MIEISKISFQYQNSKEIIKDLSLDIPENSCIAIVGNSGCGKTTLLNMIAGILHPQKGSISVRTESISYLMQEVTLLSYKTTIENVFLAYILRNNFIDESIKNKAIKMLELFQMDKSAYNKFPNELSGGMKQRIGLVQTLLTDSKLLLLDEPFNAIDVNALGAIETYIWKHVKKGCKTMVFITHNIEQALILSDKIIVMGSGYSMYQVLPTINFISLPPSQRTKTEEFKQLFFETIEKMKL